MTHARALGSLLVAVSALLGGGASAQTYPARTITLVVPFAPGGATDAIARILADPLSHDLGQQIVIETVGGAGGMIGAARVARAAPDGYTVLLHQVGLAAGMTLYPNPSFDAEKDLTGIGIVNTSASTIMARKTLPPNNMAELVKWMKEPGQNPKVAHAGVGSFGHLCGVLFVNEVGAAADQIPYRGGGPALNDLVEPVTVGGVVPDSWRSGHRKTRWAADTDDLWPATKPRSHFWHIMFARPAPRQSSTS
jgi:tripartite-type tricarboxylate transporter receptor subunit TctC